MSNSLLGTKIAFLAASGFNQLDLTYIQRALLGEQANFRIISPDHGLINGWSAEGWGHHFAVDAPLEKALASDYDMLIIPGGARNVDKLKLTAHTRRFIGSFMASSKPVAVCGDGLRIMILSEALAGLKVTGPEALKDDAEQTGAIWQGGNDCLDRNLISGSCESDDECRAYAEKLAAFFISRTVPVDQAA